MLRLQGGSELQHSVLFWWLVPSQQQNPPMGPAPAVLWRMGSQQEGHCEALAGASAVCSIWGFVSELELPSSPDPMPGAVPLTCPLWAALGVSQPGSDTHSSQGSAGNAAQLMSMGQSCLHLLTVPTLLFLRQFCDFSKSGTDPASHHPT